MSVKTTDLISLTGPCLTEPHGLVDYATIQLNPGYVIANANDIAKLEERFNSNFQTIVRHAQLLCDEDSHPEYVRGICEVIASAYSNDKNTMDTLIEFVMMKVKHKEKPKTKRKPKGIKNLQRS